MTVTDEQAGGTRYGWAVVAALTVLLAGTHGLITSGITTFDNAILADLQISRGALKLRDLIQLGSGGLWAVVIGFVALRLGARTIIYLGLGVLTAALLVYGHVSSVGQIYALHFMLAFSYSSCHVVVVLLVLTRWFATRRSTALGIILAGESLGGVVFPQIAVRLIAAVGWRDAMGWLALMPVVLAVMMVLVLREGPERLGRKPYGWRPETADDVVAPAAAEPGEERFLDYLLRGDVLAVIASAGLLFYAGGGIATHAFLFLSDQGLAPTMAATGLSLFFAAAFVGKAASGYLAERWRLLDVWRASQLVMLVGAIAITAAGANWPYPIIVCLGLGWGGCYTLSQAALMARFDGPYLARLSGITVLIEGTTAGLGAFVSGILFDRFGSYHIAFAVMMATIAAALLCTLRIRHRVQSAASGPLCAADANVA